MSIIGTTDPNLGSPDYPHKFAVNLTVLQIKTFFLNGLKETKFEKQNKTGDF